MQAAMMSSCSALSGTAIHAPSKAKSFAGSRPIAAGRKLAVRVAAEAPAAPGIETTGPNFAAKKDIQEIMDILPHRYAFYITFILR